MTSHNFCSCQHKQLFGTYIFSPPNRDSTLGFWIFNSVEYWSASHWNFIVNAIFIAFLYLSLFHLGILSPSPINYISTICLYSTLEFHHTFVCQCLRTFGVSLNFIAMKFNHFRGLSESYTVMPSVGLITLVWFCPSWFWIRIQP